MTSNEIQALLHYTEFHLITLVETMEHHITDPDIISGMYEHAHSALEDIAFSLETQYLLDNPNSSTTKPTS